MHSTPPESTPFHRSGSTRSGHLVIIGGAEDKFNERHILRRFLTLSGGQAASVLIVPVASDFPEAAAIVYTRLFTALGARRVSVLNAETRQDVMTHDAEAMMDGVTGVFLSGGDQARLATRLGGTRFAQLLAERFAAGVTIGGTSAGASAMSTSMIMRGDPMEGPSVDGVRLAPGLGILPDVVIDQHFTQRLRLSRLIAAVALNPKNLGIGIDEDTAIVVNGEGVMEILGSGTVTVVDGMHIGLCDLTEIPMGQPFAVTDLRLHILNEDIRFDLHTRGVYEYLSDYESPPRIIKHPHAPEIPAPPGAGGAHTSHHDP